MLPQWYELLMRPDADLRRFGLPARKIAEIREGQTGHRRSLVPRWCRSIGYWGRVASQVEIEYITGASQKAARRFSENWGLRFAGRHGRVPQFQLAVKVYESYLDIIDSEEEYDPTQAAYTHYILPIEAMLYPMAVEGFIEDQEANSLFELTERYAEPSTLAEMWVNSGWVVGLPQQVMYDIGGGDDRLAKRIHARLGTRPATDLRRTSRSTTPR